MSTEIIESPNKPLSKDQMLAQVRTVQEVMKTVMKDGEHYGVVPGCGSKPTLLKAGSEKLLHTFGFGTEVEVVPMFPGEEDKVGYRVTVTVRSRDGRLMGTGVGEASSEEKKWKWREAVCQEEWDEADPVERRKKWETGGSFVYQVQNNPYDLSNTILKMAKKRAQIDATLTVCACSDIFTQDVEELAENGQAPKSTGKARPSGTTPLSPPFGKAPNVPLADLDDEQLNWYADVINQSVEDPKKAKFKAKNQAMLKSLIAEIDRRNAELDAMAEREMDEDQQRMVEDLELGMEK